MKNTNNIKTTLLLASSNIGKLSEMQALLENTPYLLITPAEINCKLDVLEDGATYTENALKKARAYAAASGYPVLADDSGLEVAALGGSPGIYSARFAPIPGADDSDRRAFLLAQLQGHARPWAAQFRCVIALANPQGVTYTAEGICAGEIIPEERGDNGFGYDPIFFLPEIGKTMAEMSMEEKNILSHRARAIQAAIPLLGKVVE
jgi:XTP/dITP diphosphohydrolase